MKVFVQLNYHENIAVDLPPSSSMSSFIPGVPALFV